MAIFDKLAAIVLPKGKGVKGGAAFTPTFNPRTPIITAPTYRQHLSDIFTDRTANDSRTLLNNLVNHDPDVSAAVHSYLTIAGSAKLVIHAYNADGALDRDGIELAQRILQNLTGTSDYSLGYSNKPTMDQLANDLRYMALLRGMIGVELVLDKTYVPSELRVVDTSTLEWNEAKSGVFAPTQKPSGSNETVDLNIPTFFTSTFHQNPTSIYTYSPFVAAINTIAARQDIINELYRIMQVVGYPRLDIEVMEEVLLANVPATYRNDPNKAREFVEAELGRIRGVVGNMSARDVFVHSDAITASIINDKNPSSGMQIERVIDVLDNQNQAALKVMPAVVGKSDAGGVASTEARLFALSADALNRTVAAILTKALTLAVRLAGFDGRVSAQYLPVELRPVLELEPQLTMKGSRLRQELSLGTITDEEYHMDMFGRPPPAGAPPLSGTNFMDPISVAVDATTVTANDDPMGKSLAAEGSKSAKSNSTKSGEKTK
jgi:hypothetical protein